MAIKGFWSYVHVDDQAESGRIIQLARDVKEQFEMLAGEEIALFLDKDSLEWGDNWREAIDSNLGIVPVLRTHVLSFIAENFLNDKKSMLGFLAKTFYGFQYRNDRHMKNIVDLHHKQFWYVLQHITRISFILHQRIKTSLAIISHKKKVRASFGHSEFI